nr:MAG TPA: hypothetical protein [Caudoviricetes sp.]
MYICIVKMIVKSSSKNSSRFDLAKVLKQYETYKQSKRKVKRFGNDVPSV